MALKGNKEGRILDLIGQIYDAALDEALWTGLAEPIAAAFDSHSTAISVNSRAGGARFITHTSNFTDRLIQENEAYYHKVDIWAGRAMELGMSKVYASKDLVSDSSFRRSEFYRDWARKLDAMYVVGTVCPLDEDVVVFGIHRSETAKTFGEYDKRLVSKLVPHLLRALQIQKRLSQREIQRIATLDALDRTEIGTIVVDAGGRILYANHKADLLLREADGICCRYGRLATTDRPATQRLTRLISDAVATAAGKHVSAGGSLAIQRQGRSSITALVAPFRPVREGFGMSLPAAILFVRDPEWPTLLASTLQQTFGLTPAEANIAGGLAEGRSIEDIAAQKNISLHTARSHLKSIFLKTNTNRQAQVVAILSRSVAMLRQSD